MMMDKQAPLQMPDGLEHTEAIKVSPVTSALLHYDSSMALKE